ncbi:MAG: hypothetical protein K1X28_00055 [Parachlamydiales bacterium]|nr:hypothetical protein [Parachlamydiales bacterium]
MTVSSDLTRFITIAETSNDSAKFAVVLKSFPDVADDKKIKFTVKNFTLATGPDKNAAEKAAKLFADVHSVPYIPQGKGVVTITPFCDSFSAIELSADDHVVLRHGLINDLVQAVLCAMKYKKTDDLEMVLPSWLKLDGSKLEYPKWTQPE